MDTLLEIQTAAGRAELIICQIQNDDIQRPAAIAAGRTII